MQAEIGGSYVPDIILDDNRYKRYNVSVVIA